MKTTIALFALVVVSCTPCVKETEATKADTLVVDTIKAAPIDTAKVIVPLNIK